MVKKDTPRRKQTKIVPTPKQRKLAKLIIANGSHAKPLGKLVSEAGYSDAMTDKPSVITESKGFKAALIMAGATEEKLASVFNSGLEANRVDVIKGISQTSDVPDISLRVATAEKIAKIYGITADKDKGGNTYNTFIQSNNLDPNTSTGKQIVDNTLAMLMQQTKRDDTWPHKV